MGRILAIDYGKKRVGLAVTDPQKIIANGLATVKTSEILDYIQSYLAKETVECFIIGYAKTLGNQNSESMEYIRPFVKKLQKYYPKTPVKWIDERFTSQIAKQTMIDGGLKKKQRQVKENVDKISATIILQSYLENQNI